MESEYQLINLEVMKKPIYLLLTLSIFIFSCQRTPVASFAVSDITVLEDEDVYFTNSSFDAARFEWDFGDGVFASAPNVVHSYNQAGVYDARLTVWSNNGNKHDEAYQTITVLEPAILEVEVLEYYDLYAVEGASVILYPTYQDWLEETNMIDEAYTDQNGFVVFTYLMPGRYYVDVWEANHDNYTLEEEDIAFIETDFLTGGQINYFLAYVDYYVTTKSQVERSRELRGVPKGRKKK